MFFLNPFAMVVGGAMVSAPILIHLINRMRYKRIRWAAMEFLLKSQKRNRRRLIIEQLILLMLRCLLVMLAGFLVARFVGEALGKGSSTSTTHMVILDDTLSMADKAPQNQAAFGDCFAQARAHITELAQHASEAGSPQTLILLTMSDREQTLFNERLNEDSLGRLRKILDDLKPTLLHVDPADAIDAGKKLMENVKESKRWLHILSDFRDQDWGYRPANDRLHKSLQEVVETGTNVTLIDTVEPSRASSRAQTLDFHNNYAITELRPDKRVAPVGSMVPFTVEIENLGNESRDSIFIEIFENGSENLLVSRVYDVPAPPAPGMKQRYSFELLFTDGPAEGQRSRYSRITARLKDTDKQSGLEADNVRHTTVEIRKEVPTLVIDGSPELANETGGDLRVIRDALESVKGTEAVKVVPAKSDAVKGIEELLRPDLDREYSTIYLMNVQDLKGRDKKTEKLPLEKLKQFVANGGNIVWFTGDKLDRGYYNEELFEKSRGLFPVPIAEVGTNRISDDEIKRRRNSNAPKIFVLDTEHEITRGLSDVQYKIPDLLIPQHTEVMKRFEWTRDWSQDTDVRELITLANLARLDDAARRQTVRLLNQLPVNDPNLKAKNENMAKRLEKFKEDILKVVQDAKEDEMYKVAEAIDKMLNDPGDKKGDKENVALLDLWADPDYKDVKSDLVNFRKDTLYGSPLVLTRKYGKGNVVAFLTTAGTKWSGWSGGSDGGVSAFTFPMIIADLQKFLTKGGDGGMRLVGETVKFELEPTLWKDEMVRFSQVDEGKAEKIPEGGLPGFGTGIALKGQVNEGKLNFNFPPVRSSGVQYFRLYPQGREDFEERWFAFNVDTSTESNLRRVASEEVARNPTDAPPTRGTIKWTTPKESQNVLREKKSDTSESPWLYILFLLVLIVEQALAVHLSFHSRGNDAGQAAPARSAAA